MQLDDIKLSQTNHFHTVGIGASAGGLEALESLFQKMPRHTGMAFVVIQHLSPDFESRMDELLARQTKIPIFRVVDGMEVEPDSIYLVPPKKEMIVSNGRLLLTDKDPERGFSLPIDHFFRSLAQDAGRYAIGVILSGTGSDGSRGIRTIQEAGGLVVCQSEDTARFDGMPRSALETGTVDLVLPPDAIPDALVKYVAKSLSAEKMSQEELIPVEDEGLEKILRLIRSGYDIDFAHYKASTIVRRTSRRLAMTQCRDLDEYAAFIEQNPEELDNLYKDYLIGVTRFFRDKEAFRSIEEEVIPKILQRADSPHELRIWIAGCGTGEEAYSLAMLMFEATQASSRPIGMKIFATDVHRDSLEIASLGRYPEESLVGVSDERRERHFVQDGDMYRVNADLRRLIVFARHNILSDAPFTRMDLVSCRNLLIYLQPTAQKKAMSLFHFGLKPSGFLFLGPSETPGGLSDEFEPLSKKWRIYRKRRDIRLPADMRLPLPSASLMAASGSRVHFPSAWTTPAPDSSLLTTYDRLLDTYMPLSILVDDKFELIHLFGGAEAYTKLRSGRPTASILDLIHEDLKTALSGALSRAEKELTPIRYTGLAVRRDGKDELVRLIVEPIQNQRADTLCFLIRLESLESPNPRSQGDDQDTTVDVQKMSRDYIASLEAELRFAKENLQATIEELETSNEELQAANEELVAANEELQSTNEELHSVNEELYTVNAEHQRKIEELTELTNDMDYLLHNAEIGVVFLDHAFCIRKFTAKVAKIFGLLPQDLGRPFESFAHTLDHGQLMEDLNEVLATEKPLEREVRSRRGDAFVLRILPYREKLRVSGVVLTLIDVGNLKRAEARVRRLSAIVENSEDAIIGHDLTGTIIAWNQGAAELYQYSAKEALGQNVTMLIMVPEQASEYMSMLERLANGERVNKQIETARRRKDGSTLYISLKLSPIRDESGGLIGVSAIDRDITQRKKAEEEVRRAIRQREQFLAMLSHELRTPLAAMLSAARVLEDKDMSAPLRGDACEVMARQAQHMARLLDDLLDVSRMRQDKIEMRKQLIDMRNTVEDVIETLQPRIHAADVDFFVEVSPEPVMVYADPARLKQMQLNLLTNALRYTPKGRRIHMSLGVEGNDAVIRVRDDGVGIPKEVLTQVFEPFWQSEHTAELSKEGMGLGLALVRSIVRAHNGHVQAFSDGPHKGSEFVVHLPLVYSAQKQEEPSLEKNSMQASVARTIALVEDDEDSRHLLRALLEKRGHTVYTAEDGVKGVELIKTHKPDIALVDIGLPGLSGLRVAREIRDEFGEDGIRLVALTGFGQQSDRDKVYSAGFDQHLVKPVDLNVLMSVIESSEDS